MMKSAFTAAADLLRQVRSARVRRYLALTYFVDAGLVFVLLVAIQSYLPEQYDASEALAGYVLAAYGASKLAGQLGAGWVIDRIGPRRGLIAGLCLTGTGQVAMIFGVAEPNAVIPAALLYGLGGAVIWPSLFALAAGEFEEGERARLTAGMTVVTGLALGTALCLGLALPESFPYAAAIVVCVAFTAGALLAARSFPGTAAGTVEATRDARRQLTQSIRDIVSARRIAFSLIILLQAAILGALLAIFRSFGRETLHVSLRGEMLLLLPAGAIGGGAVVLGGLLADRVGRIPVLGTGYLIATFSIWGLSTTTSHAAVVPLAAFCAAGLGLALPCTSALSLDLSRSGGTGTLLGWFLTMEGIGHAAGPAAGAWINQKGGAAPVLWLVGGLAAAIAIVALVPPIWARRPDVEPVRHRVRALMAGTAKGALVFSVGFPVIFAYLAMDSSSQVYGDITTHGPRDRMEVAITFDDGPNDPWTLQIADELDKYDVKGTFFIIGQNADVHPEIVRNLALRGELIGNHSYSHHKSDAVTELNYGELWKAESAIARAAGVCPAVYRPPNGFHTPWQLHTVASHGMKTVTWDVIPRDWKDPPPDVIVNRVLNSVQPGSIILLHDGYNTTQGADRSATLNALPGIIEGLRAKGYDIVRLDKLLDIPAYLPTCDGVQAVHS
jgi:peptidoglycan/xylan/chitin deacetylase (PgdA/CDA1 family)/predicted MFS family arabinose efflux permease